MHCNIYSRKFKRLIEFFHDERTGYIWVEVQSGRRQLCEGGSMHGRTLVYIGDSRADLERVCSGWWKQHLRSKNMKGA